MADSAAFIDFDEGAAPATPAAGKVRVYAKTDGLPYSKDDAGSETAMAGGGSGDVATDAIFDAKGDLPVGTGSNTAQKLTAGVDGTILMAASGETTGLKWHALTTVDATLGGDVAMATGGTFYDGPSGSFAAGTWLIWYKAIFASGTTGQTNDFAVKLWDGTTVYDESSNGVLVNVSSGTIPVEVSGFAVVTLGSTATLKISGTAIRANATMKRDTATGSASSHTATRLSGIKIA